MIFNVVVFIIANLFNSFVYKGYIWKLTIDPIVLIVLLKDGIKDSFIFSLIFIIFFQWEKVCKSQFSFTSMQPVCWINISCFSSFTSTCARWIFNLIFDKVIIRIVLRANVSIKNIFIVISFLWFIKVRRRHWY